MHDKVDSIIKEGFFEFFDENASSADLGKGFVEDFVTTSGDGYYAKLGIAKLALQLSDHHVGLQSGEFAFASADSDHFIKLDSVILRAWSQIFFALFASCGSTSGSRLKSVRRATACCLRIS